MRVTARAGEECGHDRKSGENVKMPLDSFCRQKDERGGRNLEKCRNAPPLANSLKGERACRHGEEEPKEENKGRGSCFVIKGS